MKLAVLFALAVVLAVFRLMSIGAHAQTPTVSDPSGGKSVAIVSNEYDPSEITLDDENIYWVSDNGTTIKKISKAGGAPVTLATGKYIGQILVDEDSIFFTVFGEIRRVSKNGGTAAVLVKSDLIGYQRTQWAVDKTNLYYFDEVGVPPGTMDKNPLLKKVNKAGGVPVTLSANTYGPTGLGTDGVNLYWGDVHHDIVKKVSVNGGPTVFVGHCFHPGGIAVDEQNVYCVATGYKVIKFKKALPAQRPPPVVQGDSINGVLARDEANFFTVATGKNGHGIYRLSKQGGPLQLLVALEWQLSRFAVDATGVYWVDPVQGTVMRIVP
jgi:hypothetical protein